MVHLISVQARTQRVNFPQGNWKEYENFKFHKIKDIARIFLIACVLRKHKSLESIPDGQNIPKVEDLPPISGW